MNIDKGSKNFASSSSMEINMSKGLVNLTFAYRSILIARWMSRNCCSDGVWYSCLVCGNNVPWRPDPLAKCSMIIDAMYVSLCACEQVPIWVEQQRLGKEEEQPLDCLCAWAAWVCGAMALSHSFLLPFSLFFLSLCFFCISLLVFLFFLFFLSHSFFFKQARADIFL